MWLEEWISASLQPFSALTARFDPCIERDLKKKEKEKKTCG